MQQTTRNSKTARTMSSLIEASEKKWSAASALYIRNFEPHTASMGVTLLSSLRLRFSDHPLRVIECGSGAGAVAMDIINLLTRDEQHDHQFTMVDLSASMMALAQQRLESFSLKPTTLVADATSLPFPDSSFDRYVSNMTVHYAPDADAFLREASRVLSPGGLAGFTVWGHEAASTAFTLLPAVKKKMGLEGPPAARSSFHMGEDDSALKQRVLAAGFSHCVVWHAQQVIEAISPEKFAETMIDGANSTREEVLGWPEDAQQLFRAEVLEVARGVLAEGRPLGLDVCYCVAQK